MALPTPQPCDESRPVIVVDYDYFGSVWELLIPAELLFGDSLVPSTDVAACPDLTVSADRLARPIYAYSCSDVRRSHVKQIHRAADPRQRRGGARRPPGRPLQRCSGHL